MNQLPNFGASFAYANALQSFQFGSAVGGNYGCGQVSSPFGFDIQSQMNFFYSLMQAQQSMNQGWQSFCGCEQKYPGDQKNQSYHKDHGHHQGPRGHNHGSHRHNDCFGRGQGDVSKFCSPWGKHHHQCHAEPDAPKPDAPKPDAPKPDAPKVEVQKPQVEPQKPDNPSAPLVQQSLPTPPKPKAQSPKVTVSSVPRVKVSTVKVSATSSPFGIAPGQAVPWVGGVGFPVL